VHVSLAPLWFDPADTQGMITPFMVMYALHDAMVKPMPGNPFAPSLAESWTMSPDGLTYEFVLRKGAKFHDGEAVTAEDVKFSFERYAARPAIKEGGRHGHPTPTGRFQLKPWPDFPTFTPAPRLEPAGSSRGGMWKVGDDGFTRPCAFA
jgi:peptide/nickel transport system substrate-binding protein